MHRAVTLLDFLETEHNAAQVETKGGLPMKLIIALAAAAIVSSLTAITSAHAQKDPACIEKCNRDHKAAGGTRQVRGTGQLIRACVSACPAAKK